MEAWTTQSWNAPASVCAKNELSPSFHLPLDFLEGVLAFGLFLLYRFLLGANHIELFPLGLGLLFKVPSHLLRSSCPIYKDFLLYRIVRGL